MIIYWNSNHTQSTNSGKKDDGEKIDRLPKKRWRLASTILLLVLMVALPFHPPTRAQSEDETDELALSPYWTYSIHRWETIILQEAERRSVDPDLIAALIWKESHGRSTARGPAGAVGLMMVMPFPWRPSPEELTDPWTNLYWGTRALAHTIRDGNGDMYYALAAYNGSWSQIHLGVTRRYAASILEEYSRAVAVKKGLPEDGEWIALFAVQGTSEPRTITLLGPHQPLVRYTERPWGQGSIPTVPQGLPPDTVAIAFENELCTDCQVNGWIIAGNGSLPTSCTTRSSLPYETGYAMTRRLPLPSSQTVGTTFTSPVDAPPPDTSIPTASPTPSPTPTGTPTETPTDIPTETPTDTPTPTATAENGSPTPAPVVTPTIPTPTPSPTLAPTNTPTQTAPVDCSGGPLSMETWHLDRVVGENGWTATIYVVGYGGDCLYTYRWNGEIKGEFLTGPLTFQVNHTDRYAVIMGTVSVTSAGQTVEKDLWITPPD